MVRHDRSRPWRCGPVLAAALLCAGAGRADAGAEPRDWSLALVMGYPVTAAFRIDHMPSRAWRVGVDLGGLLAFGVAGLHVHRVLHPGPARVFLAGGIVGQVRGQLGGADDPSLPAFSLGGVCQLGLEWVPRHGFRVGLAAGIGVGRWHAVEQDRWWLPAIDGTLGYAW